MKALSPGKLILSGEHAVVHGSPAIAFAVDRFAETTIQPQLSKLISFSLLNLRYDDSFTVQTLREIKRQITSKYQLFLDGKCGIREVLGTPFELAQFTCINFLDHLNSKLINGLNIRTQSSIPVGCGMGSSAAVVLSVLRAIALYFGIDVAREKYLKLGYEAEKLQHGYPSGLDLYASLYGGCVYFNEGKSSQCNLPDMPMYVVDTGTPEVSTGECVMYVADRFKENPIWKEFEITTTAMFKALTSNDLFDIKALIRLNHQLLIRVGVVPIPVQQFIYSVEKTGAAAKICGAGAVQGDRGGIVLVVSESGEVIKPICDQFGYNATPVKPDTQGLHTE